MSAPADPQAAFTCADSEPLLPLVTDGALDAATEPALFAHLAGCARCQGILAQHDLIEVALERDARERPRRRATILRLWPAAAAAAVVVGLGVWWQGSATAAPADPVAAAPALEPDTRIRGFIRPDGRPVYLVQQDGRAFLVDPGVDRFRPPARPGRRPGAGRLAQRRPVRLRWRARPAALPPPAPGP